MHYSIGLEQAEPGRWLAWVLEIPGCFAKGDSREAVLEGAPAAIADYFNWRDGYQRVSEEAARSLHLTVSEEFRNYETLDGYWVNAFFEHDRVALSAGELDDIRWLISCTRSDLIAAVRRLPAASLEQPLPGERFGSVAGILKHVATAERWYFDKLGLAAPRESLGSEVFNMLEVVRRNTIVQLPRLVNDSAVRESHGELWSARKVVRRTLYHERVHTWHIQRLAGQLTSA